MAGLAVGFWNDLDELKELNAVGQSFQPTMNEARKEKLLQGWKKKKAVAATQLFAEVDEEAIKDLLARGEKAFLLLDSPIRKLGSE